MALIRIITGSESFACGNSNMIVSVMPCRGFPLPEDKPIFIGDAAKRRLVVSTPSRPSYISASTSGIREQGQWFDGNYEVPDGAVLRVFARQQARVGGRRGIAEQPKVALIFLKARADGPLQRIQLQTINDQFSAQVPVVIEGRYDVLSIREAGALRVPITEQDMRQARPERVRELLSKTEIAPARRAPERSTRETVRTHDGEAVTVETKRTSRAINLG